jgi:hypothetical protein
MAWSFGTMVLPMGHSAIPASFRCPQAKGRQSLLQSTFIPAKAGIQLCVNKHSEQGSWIPAFAGMTAMLKSPYTRCPGIAWSFGTMVLPMGHSV